jgi:hypothetical protein
VEISGESAFNIQFDLKCTRNWHIERMRLLPLLMLAPERAGVFEPVPVRNGDAVSAFIRSALARKKAFESTAV